MATVEEVLRVYNAAVAWGKSGSNPCGKPECACTECKLWELVGEHPKAGALAKKPDGTVADDSHYEDGYIFGRQLDDPEHMRWDHQVFATRDEAITCGRKDFGREMFQTAYLVCEKSFLPNPLDGQHACDQADQPSDWGEPMFENWQDKIFANDGHILSELQNALDKVWDEFENKHQLFVWGLWTKDVEFHEGDDADET